MWEALSYSFFFILLEGTARTDANSFEESIHVLRLCVVLSASLYHIHKWLKKKKPTHTRRHQISGVQVICAHRQWHMALSSMQAAPGHNRFNLFSTASLIMPVPWLWPGIVLFRGKTQQISSESSGKCGVSNLHMISKILEYRALRNGSNLQMCRHTEPMNNTDSPVCVIRLPRCSEIKSGWHRDINTRGCGRSSLGSLILKMHCMCSSDLHYIKQHLQQRRSFIVLIVSSVNTLCLFFSNDQFF